MISTAEPVMNQLSLSSESKKSSNTRGLDKPLCDVYNITEELYGNILIAITEAVNNAIIHGNQNLIEKTTSIDYKISKTELVFNVVDEGIGFDYNDIPDPTDSKNMKSFTAIVIFLMRHLADSIEFFVL